MQKLTRRHFLTLSAFGAAGGGLVASGLVPAGRVPSSGVRARHPHNSLSEMPSAKAPPPSASGIRRL